jgi:mannonate dehydratase
MAGEANSAPGYETMGRLYAVGYLRGLMEVVARDYPLPETG